MPRGSGPEHQHGSGVLRRITKNFPQQLHMEVGMASRMLIAALSLGVLCSCSGSGGNKQDSYVTTLSVSGLTLTPARITASPGSSYTVNYEVHWTQPGCDRSIIRVLLSNQADPPVGSSIPWFTINESAAGKQTYGAPLSGSRGTDGSLSGEDRLGGTPVFTSVSLAGLDLTHQVYLILDATLTGAPVQGTPTTLRASQVIPITVDPMP